jgi:hypothetical protein
VIAISRLSNLRARANGRIWGRRCASAARAREIDETQAVITVRVADSRDGDGCIAVLARLPEYLTPATAKRHVERSGTIDAVNDQPISGVRREIDIGRARNGERHEPSDRLVAPKGMFVARQRHSLIPQHSHRCGAYDGCSKCFFESPLRQPGQLTSHTIRVVRLEREAELLLIGRATHEQDHAKSGRRKACLVVNHWSDTGSG